MPVFTARVGPPPSVSPRCVPASPSLLGRCGEGDVSRGGHGIRTHGDGVAASAVFKTAALVHYASPPRRIERTGAPANGGCLSSPCVSVDVVARQAEADMRVRNIRWIGTATDHADETVRFFQDVMGLSIAMREPLSV